MLHFRGRRAPPLQGKGAWCSLERHVRHLLQHLARTRVNVEDVFQGVGEREIDAAGAAGLRGSQGRARLALEGFLQRLLRRFERGEPFVERLRSGFGLTQEGVERLGGFKQGGQAQVAAGAF